LGKGEKDKEVRIKPSRGLIEKKGGARKRKIA